MLFNSAEFFIFFGAVVCVLFALPLRLRWVWLLAASYFFYASWRVEYLGLIVLSTAVDYGVARGLGRVRRIGYRRALLGVSLTVNLGLLFTFKYFNFFVSSVETVLNSLGMTYLVPHLSVLLPVGISFYTFQTLSYTIDVYRGEVDAERHAGRFALFVAFFPQLVAGPIERANRLLPQLSVEQSFDYKRVRSGLFLILWGLFKKMVIADRLGVVVDFVYASPERCPGPLLVVATIFFAFQIYCDFSGYTDIARGTARVMGIDLMRNFDRPYTARSIADFWRRWHLSLTTWFRDYVYIPLGGNRSSARAWMTNVMIVFLVSGLWHGASWTFVIWGLLHGSFYFAERVAGNALGGGSFMARKKFLRDNLKRACTFVAVCVAWVFFRAASLSDAVSVFGNSLRNWSSAYTDFLALLPAMDLSTSAFCVTGLCTLFLWAVEAIQRERDIEDLVLAWPLAQRWTTYVLLTLAIWNLGMTYETPFVYFQF